MALSKSKITHIFANLSSFLDIVSCNLRDLKVPVFSVTYSYVSSCVFQIEEDLSSLQKKHTNLENEFDIVNEKYNDGVVKQEAAEKRVTEVRSYCPLFLFLTSCCVYITCALGMNGM